MDRGLAASTVLWRWMRLVAVLFNCYDKEKDAGLVFPMQIAVPRDQWF